MILAEFILIKFKFIGILGNKYFRNLFDII